MRLNPYLTYNGQCEAAFRFYESCLGGKILFMMRYGESPMAGQTPPGFENKIMHATLDVRGQVLSGVDTAPDCYQKPQGYFVMLGLDDAAEAERIFHELSQDAVVQMPLQETFWAQRFGVLIDRFGTPWMLNCEKPQS